MARSEVRTVQREKRRSVNTFFYSSTVWTKKSAKTIRKQVRGCLLNLYQLVAIHLKYVLLVLL